MREKRINNLRRITKIFLLMTFISFPFTAAPMTNSNVWMRAVYRFHSSAIKSMIVKMVKMKRTAIFRCLIALKESLSAKDYWDWVEWEALAGVVFFNASNVMEVSSVLNIKKTIVRHICLNQFQITTAATGLTRKIVQKNQLYAHQMNLNATMDVAFL